MENGCRGFYDWLLGLLYIRTLEGGLALRMIVGVWLRLMVLKGGVLLKNIYLRWLLLERWLLRLPTAVNKVEIHHSSLLLFLLSNFSIVKLYDLGKSLDYILPILRMICAWVM